MAISSAYNVNILRSIGYHVVGILTEYMKYSFASGSLKVKISFLILDYSFYQFCRLCLRAVLCRISSPSLGKLLLWIFFCSFSDSNILNDSIWCSVCLRCLNPYCTTGKKTSFCVCCCILIAMILFERSLIEETRLDQHDQISTIGNVVSTPR